MDKIYFEILDWIQKQRDSKFEAHWNILEEKSINCSQEHIKKLEKIGYIHNKGVFSLTDKGTEYYQKEKEIRAREKSNELKEKEMKINEEKEKNSFTNKSKKVLKTIETGALEIANESFENIAKDRIEKEEKGIEIKKSKNIGFEKIIELKKTEIKNNENKNPHLNAEDLTLEKEKEKLEIITKEDIEKIKHLAIKEMIRMSFNLKDQNLTLKDLNELYSWNLKTKTELYDFEIKESPIELLFKNWKKNRIGNNHFKHNFRIYKVIKKEIDTVLDLLEYIPGNMSEQIFVSKPINVLPWELYISDKISFEEFFKINSKIKKEGDYFEKQENGFAKNFLEENKKLVNLIKQKYHENSNKIDYFYYNNLKYYKTLAIHLEEILYRINNIFRSTNSNMYGNNKKIISFNSLKIIFDFFSNVKKGISIENDIKKIEKGDGILKEIYGFYNLDKPINFIYNSRIKSFLREYYGLKTTATFSQISEVYLNKFKKDFKSYFGKDLAYKNEEDMKNKENLQINLELDSLIYYITETEDFKNITNKKIIQIENFEIITKDYYEYKGIFLEKILGNDNFIIFKGCGNLKNIGKFSKVNENYQRKTNSNLGNLKSYLKNSGKFKFLPEIILSSLKEDIIVMKSGIKISKTSKDLNIFRIDGNHRIEATLNLKMDKGEEKKLNSHFSLIIFNNSENREQIEANIFRLINDKQIQIPLEHSLKVIIENEELEDLKKEDEELYLTKIIYNKIKDKQEFKEENYEKKLSNINLVVKTIIKRELFKSIGEKEKEILKLFNLILEIQESEKIKEFKKREDFFLICFEIYFKEISDKAKKRNEEKAILFLHLEKYYSWFKNLEIEENIKNSILWKVFLKIGDLPKKDEIKQNESNQEEKDKVYVTSLCSKTESKILEFKGSFQYHLNENISADKKSDKNLNFEVLKTISAFLNTKGGKIFIGIKEDKNTKEKTLHSIHKTDYKAMAVNNLDDYKLKIEGVIKNSFCEKDTLSKYIELKSYEFDEKTFLELIIEKPNSENRKLYMFNFKEEKKEMKNYCLRRNNASSEKIPENEFQNYSWN
jgi:hypothetical protein